MIKKDNMGPKGIGPNKLGAVKTPSKILGAIAGAVAPALVKGAAGALAGKLMGGGKKE